MPRKLAEMETNILIYRDLDYADIYTCDPTMMTKLDKMVADNPDTWKLVRVIPDDDGSADGKRYRCPKRCVSFRGGKKREYSEEEKAIMSERMLKLREAKHSESIL